MMKKLIVVTLSALIVAGFGLAEELSPEEQKAALDALMLKIKQNSLSSKEIKQLGLDDDGEKIDIDLDGFTYSLDFRNKSLVDLNDLKVECLFFYEEESAWRAGQTSYGAGREGRSSIERKCYEDSLDLSLLAGERYKSETRPFVIKSWVVDSGWYDPGGTPDRKDSDPLGLWVRISYKTSSGQTITRDICEPESLSARVSWVESE